MKNTCWANRWLSPRCQHKNRLRYVVILSGEAYRDFTPKEKIHYYCSYECFSGGNYDNSNPKAGYALYLLSYYFPYDDDIYEIS